jgi:5-methylcytosine-specific restriction endonuclease McrA
MPLQRSRYPPNWEAISRRIRLERAQGRCEQCGAENGQPHPITGSRVVLTVAHLDHNPESADEARMRALCQRCHLAYDRPRHILAARATHWRKKHAGMALLPFEEPLQGID